MTCAACGTANDPDAAFCKRCGTRLESMSIRRVVAAFAIVALALAVGRF